MEAVLAILYSLIFLWLIYRWKAFNIPGLSRHQLAFFFVAKLTAGMALTAVYTFYYTDRTTADIYKYFDDSAYLFNALFTAPGDFLNMLTGIGGDAAHLEATYYTHMNTWIRTYETSVYNDSHTIIRFNALLRFFSFGYFTVHTVFMCFFSFIGFANIYRAIFPLFEKRRQMLGYLLFLLPSVLFWSSGVLKEGLLFLAMGLLLHSFFSMTRNGFRWFLVPGLLFSIGLLLILKFYILVALLPVMFAYWWSLYGKGVGVIWKYPVVLLTGGLAVASVHHFIPGLNILEILTRKQHDFIRHAEFLQSGSQIALTPLSADPISFLLLVPEAIINSLLRPFFWEIGSAFTAMAAAENLLFAVFAVVSLVHVKKPTFEELNLFLFLVGFVFILFTLVGWITPVMGAIVRYKIPGLPFIFAAFLLLLNTEKLTQRFPFIQRFL